MNSYLKTVMSVMLAGMIGSMAYAQAIDEARMERDIKVAENVLSTLIKDELGEQGRFFGFHVKGSYQAGYGVTFDLPREGMFGFSMRAAERAMRQAAIAIEREGYRYRMRSDGDDFPVPPTPEPPPVVEEAGPGQPDDYEADSANTAYQEGLIRAAKIFIVDYGDLISQLRPTERIVVTNRGDRQQSYYFPAGNRRLITVEGKVSDVLAVRDGKLTRDQAMKRLEVVNTESVEKREPDLEMLASIFGRLYRPDLSDTYFVEGNVYYDRLKDFGAVFYMRVVSSIERGGDRYRMPTLKLDNLTREEREQKVTELYPRFEREIKEHILEYGRTVKSLDNDESLIFNIKMTSCVGCGIPSTLELGLSAKVLNDFAGGKIDRQAAISKFTVKKGPAQ